MRCWLAAMMLCSAPVVAAAPNANEIASYRALAEQDARLATVGYRLASANAPFCVTKARYPGWLLHSYRQYPDIDVAKAAFTFPTPLAVAAVAPGSAADLAGIKTGFGLSELEGGIWWGGELRVHKPNVELVDTINKRLTAAFAKPGPVVVTFQTSDGQSKTVHLDPPALCASDFWVDARTKADAGADGEKVRITSGLMAFVSDDDELAALVAHEFAHNLLGHPQRLALVKSGKTKAIRETEVEADRLSVWLMANAGYEATAALRFAERFGRTFGLGVFSDGTHPRWKKRVASIAAEIQLIGQSSAENGLRDPPLLRAIRHQQ